MTSKNHLGKQLERETKEKLCIEFLFDFRRFLFDVPATIWSKRKSARTLMSMWNGGGFWLGMLAVGLTRVFLLSRVLQRGARADSKSIASHRVISGVRHLPRVVQRGACGEVKGRRKTNML